MSDLGTAFTAAGLVPGVPDDLRELAARLSMYASGAADSAARLRGLGTQEWVGHAAEAFRSQVRDVPTKLQRGADAFTAAAGALTAHARVLEDAQRQAGQALAVWEDAQATSARWQAATADYHTTHPALIPGVAPPPLLGPPPPSTTDPGAEGRQQAQRQLDTARGELETSAVRLAAVLHDAADGAPHHPGFLSQAWHQVSEFGKGAGEAVGGLAEFAFKETPIYAELDPQGFLHQQEAMAKGLLYGVEHPKQFGEALLDWNTWAHDPARAAGHLVPQILAMLLTGGAAGAARGADASERLAAVSEEIDRLEAIGTPVFEPVDQSSALKELADLGLDPATPSGQAAFKQIGSPYGGIDDWSDAPLLPGQRVAFGSPGITEFGVKVDGEFTETDARSYFESLQVAGKRIRSGSDVPGPTMRPAVHIYEVSGENPVDAATAPTLNNPQFGPGGRQQVYTPEVYDLIESGRLQKVAEFRFDPKSLPSSTEDPVFRMVDPTLPRRPLTIGGATRKGALAGGAAGLLGSDAPVLTRTERAR